MSKTAAEKLYRLRRDYPDIFSKFKATMYGGHLRRAGFRSIGLEDNLLSFTSFDIGKGVTLTYSKIGEDTSGRYHNSRYRILSVEYLNLKINS